MVKYKKRKNIFNKTLDKRLEIGHSPSLPLSPVYRPDEHPGASVYPFQPKTQQITYTFRLHSFYLYVHRHTPIMAFIYCRGKKLWHLLLIRIISLIAGIAPIPYMSLKLMGIGMLLRKWSWNGVCPNCHYVLMRVNSKVRISFIIRAKKQCNLYSR